MKEPDRLDAPRRVHQAVRLVLVCANEECRERLFTLHANGPAVVEMIMRCPKCGAKSRFDWTGMGVDIYLTHTGKGARAEKNGKSAAAARTVIQRVMDGRIVEVAEARGA